MSEHARDITPVRTRVLARTLTFLMDAGACKQLTDGPEFSVNFELIAPDRPWQRQSV